MPASALLKLVRDYEVLPRWDDIPLPEGMSEEPLKTKSRQFSGNSGFCLSWRPNSALEPRTLLIESLGRSLNSSKLAFDEMHRQIGFYQLHAPSAYPQQAPQAQIHPPSILRKRPLPGSEVLATNFPAIQPKPPGLSPAPYTTVAAESPGSFRPSPGDSAGEPSRKRRGRPSNAQIEQEKAAAAAEGREWQPRPPRPPRKKKSQSGPDSLAIGEAEPPQKPIPQTPEIQMVEAEEENSSGRKRRRKAREDATVVRPAPYDPVRQSPTRQSPSEVVPSMSEGLPVSAQQPPQDRAQLAAGSNVHPEHLHHHQTPTTPSNTFGDNSQHLQAEQ